MKLAIILLGLGIVVLGSVPFACAAGPLPLKTGTYVLDGVPCDQANADSTVYYYVTGNNVYAFGVVPHGEWRIIKVRKDDNIYYLICECQYKGLEKPIIEYKKITIKNPTSFSIENYPKEGKKQQIFRWCNN
jgi:hypothetical protein